MSLDTLNTTSQSVVGAINEVDSNGLQEAYENGSNVDVTSTITFDADGSGNTLNITYRGPANTPGISASGQLYLAGNSVEVASAVGSTASVSGGTGTTISASDGDVSFQDDNLSSPVPISESGETALDTTSQSVVGAINEVKVTADGAFQRENADVITTSNDGTTALSASNTDTIVVGGSGINHQLTLGPATGYTRGVPVTICNFSSEFVHVFNNDSSLVWHIRPNHIGTFNPVQTGTAAGVWVCGDSAICDKLYYFDEDLATPWSQGSTPLWTTASGGGGATATQLNSAAQVGLAKGVTVATGTTWASAHSVGTNVVFLGSAYGTGAVALECNMWVNILSNATDEYVFKAGMSDDIAASSISDEIVFIYDRATNGDVWAVRTASGGTTSQIVSAVPVVAQTPQRMRWELASDQSRVDFWIGATNIGNVTTNIPSGSGSPMALQMARGDLTAGTTGRFLSNSLFHLFYSRPGV